MIFCTNNSTSKSIILSYIFLYEKLKNYSIQSFEDFFCLFVLFFVFCWFCFLLLSNNTIHVMFSTSICYWNTFQYKYITQITFHVVKQSHAQVTPKYICLLFILFVTFSVLSQLCFILWSSPPPLLFNWPRVQLYLKVPNHIYILEYIIHCLIYFGFIECLYMYFFGKNNLTSWQSKQKVKTVRVSNWIDAQFSCLRFTNFNVPPCLLPKTTDKLL